MINISRILPKMSVLRTFVCNHWLNTPQGFIKFQKTDIHQLIGSRFETIVKKYPQAIAVKNKTETLTYEELNNRANRLANSVLSQRGEKQEVIALLLEKSANFITSIFGILKTGKIFVPLDTGFPQERLAYILEDAQINLILTNNLNLSLANQLAVNGCQIFNIDDIDQEISSQNPDIEISPDAPAYLIYTSGSTGKPKGVIHNHHHSLHYCMNDTNTLLISPEDRVVFLYSCGALGGILCIFYTLLNGASLFIFNVKEDGFTNLKKWLIEEDITIYHSFATLFRHFVDTFTGTEQFPKIRLVKLGGEATLQRDIEAYKKYFSTKSILYASLGATETGTFCNFIVDHHSKITNSTVPIGYPVSDMQIVLLNEAGEEVGYGDIGEIAVKSKYLALGYWQKPEQTKAAFLPTSEDGEERIYRTGDLGRIEPDGCLIHMGRKDFQVKIRGFRIEVAEIEMALFKTGKLKEVVVVAREDIANDKKLVAYLVAQQQTKPTTQELRDYLRDKLPDYMIPSAFVFLDRLPLTPNGKVDRLALPAPSFTLENCVSPRDDLERQLIQIWESVLGIHPIGIQDNFFDLGGNSLLAVRIFAEIEQKFGHQLPLAALFPSGTVEELAQIIREKQNQSKACWSSLVKIQPQGSKPPLFLIHSLGGEILCYRNLATYLGVEQPVYGLQPQGLDGKQSPFVCIEDMAFHYIQEIQTIQPQGPYFLAGYSFGGVVAFEIAQQLHKQGQKVGLVAMFDTCRPGYSQRLSFWQRIPIHLDNLIQQGPHYIWHKAVGLSQVVSYHLQQGYKHYLNIAPQVLNAAVNSPQTEKYLDIIGANAQALSNYTFQKYPGNITLFRTEDKNRSDAVGVQYDPQFGWGDIVMGNLDIDYIHGSHLSLLDEPCVQVLAEKFRVCLEKAQMLI
ncbi:amino acid adenylation domain-containing protein [Nostoc sp. CENA67]|uniref:Amino acid adenylation domain-containing protein n=1 Tax=Amazonocrinis nigriterrae CENA67 TaxID=2794033 RepID=A0A8J7HPS2_9NOST|nr:amino acid adenylation domain-containing protein [Amazonocrinis nigriterrae]MBH8561107.1 amino acid adenylation domain-containing protein [Amazonocrinis nigriterrae CENA67]